MLYKSVKYALPFVLVTARADLRRRLNAAENNGEATSMTTPEENVTAPAGPIEGELTDLVTDGGDVADALGAEAQGNNQAPEVDVLTSALGKIEAGGTFTHAGVCTGGDQEDLSGAERLALESYGFDYKYGFELSEQLGVAGYENRYTKETLAAVKDSWEDMMEDHFDTWAAERGANNKARFHEYAGDDEAMSFEEFKNEQIWEQFHKDTGIPQDDITDTMFRETFEDVQGADLINPDAIEMSAVGEWFSDLFQGWGGFNTFW